MCARVWKGSKQTLRRKYVIGNGLLQNSQDPKELKILMSRTLRVTPAIDKDTVSIILMS